MSASDAPNSNQKTKKTWKDHLLSSGVPLEYSVARIFEDLGMQGSEEFRYERKNEAGISQVFSVDIGSTQIDLDRNFWFETLVECKYRHDGTRWVFTPSDYVDLRGPEFAELFVKLDIFCADRKFDSEAFNKFEGKYPLCEKGIELLPDKDNPKGIEQAIFQLRYAVVAKAISSLVHQKGGGLGRRDPLFLIVPIVVTTAELWRLIPGTTVEDVRRASEISDVADRQRIVVLRQTPNDTDMIETRAAFARRFNLEGRGMPLVLQAAANMSPRLREFVDSFAANGPSLFVIVQYDEVRTMLENLQGFLASDWIIKLREPETPGK